MKVILLVVVTICLILVVIHSAGAKTGNEMLSECRNAENPANSTTATEYLNYSFWLGQINGVLDTMLYYRMICLPDRVTVGQNLSIVMKYLRDHPKELHKEASYLIIQAFAEAFPCR